MGVVLHAMLAAEFPFNNEDDVERYNRNKPVESQRSRPSHHSASAATCSSIRARMGHQQRQEGVLTGQPAQDRATAHIHTTILFPTK